MKTIQHAVAFSILAGLSTACGAAPPQFGPIPDAGSETGVIFSYIGDNPTRLCNRTLSGSESKTATNGSSVSSASLNIMFGSNIQSLVSAKIGAGKVESVSVAIKDGELLSVAMEQVWAGFDKLTEGCQLQIRNAEENGSKRFTIATQVFVGDIEVVVKYKEAIDASAKADAEALLKGLQTEASLAQGTARESRMVYARGHWVVGEAAITIPAPKKK